ncbi:MAG: 5'/3'-nucleotidase SurE [Spirochaetia bacterium]
MKILLTNDDGIDSEGLLAVKTALEGEHDVWIVAPDGERSGMSHYLTLHEPIRSKVVGDNCYSCSGSPVDCVVLGLLGGIPAKPEIVLSGINKGPNLGTDIVYSGTAAAARQAAFMGVPGIALSVAGFKIPMYYKAAALFISRNIGKLKKLWNPDHFININFPNEEKPSTSVTITHPSRRIYHDKLVTFNAPNGAAYHFLDGSPVETEMESGSDWDVVSKGGVSISPVYLHPVNHEEDSAYKKEEFTIQK